MIRPCHVALLVVLMVVAAVAGCAQEASKAAAPPVTTPSEPPATTPPPAVAQEQRPPAPPPSPEEFVDNPALKDVFFESGRADIGRQGAAIMAGNVRWLRENPDQLVLVEGHTDSRGSREDNLVIAQRRADSAVSFLVGSGIESTRLQTVSYGSDRPVCRDRSPACAAKNRRVHFRVKSR